MLKFGRIVFAALGLYFSAALVPAPALAQSCNDPGGLIKTFGTFNVGDLVTLGPDCQHVRSGGPNGATGIINSVTNYGATGNGVTDDTAAINQAIASTCGANLGQLYFPAGQYLFNPPLTITCPINILGANSSINPGTSATTFLVASGTATTTDIFKIGAPNVVIRGIQFSNFNVFVQGGIASVGRHVFHFDSTPGTTTGFAEVILQNLTIPANVSAGGYSMFFNNGIGTNANGGAFNVTVRNNYLAGGINFQKSGDTLRVYDNILTGPNPGVTLTQVGGAGNFYAFNNNVTSTGGCYIIGASISATLSGGECEMAVATTEANNALIDIQTGASGAVITGMMVQNVSSTLTMLPIRNAGDHTTIGPTNRLAALGSAPYITNVAGATTLTIYPNFYNSGTSGPVVADAGTGTTFVPNITTPTRAGDVPYWNGSAYVTVAGNNSGTNCLQENASGVPSWASCGGGSGTVNSGTQFGLAYYPASAAAVSYVGSLGTTTTLLHGNAGGAPTFSAVNLGTDVTSTLPIANGGTGDTGTAWTTFTPTFNFTGGTGTSATATAGGYKQLGKTLFMRVQGTMNFTAAPTVISFNLPNSFVGVAAQTQMFPCYNNFTGSAVFAVINPSGTSGSTNVPGLITATGQPFNCLGVMEIQ